MNTMLSFEVLLKLNPIQLNNKGGGTMKTVIMSTQGRTQRGFVGFKISHFSFFRGSV